MVYDNKIIFDQPYNKTCPGPRIHSWYDNN